MTPPREVPRCSDAFLFRFEEAIKRLEARSRPDDYHPNDHRRPSSIPRRLAVEEFLMDLADSTTSNSALILTRMGEPVKKVKIGT